MRYHPIINIIYVNTYIIRYIIYVPNCGRLTGDYCSKHLHTYLFAEVNLKKSLYGSSLIEKKKKEYKSAEIDKIQIIENFK